MKQVLYKNDIYPYNVRVLLGADEEYIAKTFANLEVEDQAGKDGLTIMAAELFSWKTEPITGKKYVSYFIRCLTWM